jgi:glycosyltransferase involved in cell wall biosynthesis
MARIAILTSVHRPFDTRIFQKEARSLAAAGHEVVLVAPHDREETRDGVRIIPIEEARGRLGRMLLSPLRLLRQVSRLRPDVCHFHDPELIPLGIAISMMGPRVVYDVHENVPKDILAKAYLPTWIRPMVARMAGFLQRAGSRAFAMVVVAREDLQDAFRGHRNILLIRNFPMLAMFGDRPPANAPADHFQLVYAGGLTPIRGVGEMIAALGEVPAEHAARLTIYGRFSPSGFEQEIRALPSFRLVDYHGEVPYEQLPAGLAQAHAGVVCFLPVPNNVNSGPTKLFEYMASGLPVVASAFPLWREVIEGSDCGICVDPTDPSAIARAYDALARDPAGRRRMGQNGMRAVRERYNWEAEAVRLVRAYEGLLAG